MPLVYHGNPRLATAAVSGEPALPADLFYNRLGSVFARHQFLMRNCFVVQESGRAAAAGDDADRAEAQQRQG